MSGFFVARAHVVGLLAALAIAGCGGHSSPHATTSDACINKHTREPAPCSESDSIPRAPSSSSSADGPPYDVNYLEERLPKALARNGDGSLDSTDCIRKTGNEYDCIGVLIPEDGQGEQRVQIDATLDPQSGDIHYVIGP